jgi:hypothetical protein
LVVARSVSFAGVELHPDGSVRYAGEWQDTSACFATVDTVGQIRGRATLTRVSAGALIAGPVGAVVGALFRKRMDERECWLVVAGDRYDWVVPVRPHLQGQARQFAAALNTQARQWAERQARV